MCIPFMRWMVRFTGKLDVCMNDWMAGWTDGLMAGWMMDGWMNEWMDG